MQNFSYEIRVNDEGRSYIHLPDDYKPSLEDNFMVIEIATYIMYDLLDKQEKKKTLPEEFLKQLTLAADVLASLGNQLAKMHKEQNEFLDDINNHLNNDI